MINPQWLELPMSRTNFHGPEDVQAIEVRLYVRTQRRDFNDYTQHTIFKGARKDIPIFSHLFPDLALGLTFSSSKYPCLEQISMVSQTFEKGKRKDQGVPQSQTAALPRHQEEEETDKSKQAQIDQTYKKH